MEFVPHSTLSRAIVERGTNSIGQLADRNFWYIVSVTPYLISLYDSSAEAKLAPIFVTNTAINVTLMQQVTIHVLWSGSICTMD